MAHSTSTNGKDNLVGSLWMIAAMAAFAIEDALVKDAAQTLPVGQVLALFGLGGMLLFAGMLKFNREPLFIKDVVSLPMRIRIVFEVIGRLFYVLAIAFIPLSTATVILQATPLVVVTGAVLFLGEKVSPVRWLAIFIGLLGVILIVQPGADGFSQLSLLAVIGMIGFAGRDLASRMAPPTIGTARLGFYGFLSVLISGLLYSSWAGEVYRLPSKPELLSIVIATVAGVIAYSCLMKAMRTGEVSAVTPFRYTRLLFGCSLGLLFFGEEFTASMLIGSALIVSSGLFIGWRGKKVVTKGLEVSR
ncbi:DMT family transporter [Neptuniibacter sp. QD48_11]|uniref:DMT family transporter n=1 Tax=Neptuniibacter sp. QD48_11 TaxID=3398211 RepID=UPI0039F527EC